MEILYGALVYLGVTFPLAYFWHLKVFKNLYEKWDYAGKNPYIPLGFASMVVQGFVLSYLYFSLNIGVWTLMFGMGLFLWSTHVIAAMAKSRALRNYGYFALETVYLALQFGIFGFLVQLL